MRRREFISLLGIAGTLWPLAADAQHYEQTPRVSVLMGGLEVGDPSGQAEIMALEEGLRELGWTRGQNIDVNYYWPGAQTARVRAAADEIIATHPDLVLSRSTPAPTALMRATMPIVFVLVTDPEGSGFVQSLGRPGFDLTGFSTFAASAGAKRLALLKEAAPKVSWIAFLFNPETAPFAEGYLSSAEVAGQANGTTVVSVPCSSNADIEDAFSARAREGTSGMIGIADAFIADPLLTQSGRPRPRSNRLKPRPLLYCNHYL